MTTESTTAAEIEVDAEAKAERARLERDIVEAERRHAKLLDERKRAPKGVRLGRTFETKRDAMIRRLVPEAIAKPDAAAKRRGVYMPGATMEVAFNVPEKHEAMMHGGWIPVADFDGTHADDGGDLMYKRSIAFARDRVKEEAATSRERLMQAPANDLHEAAAGGGGEIVKESYEVSETKLGDVLGKDKEMDNG